MLSVLTFLWRDEGYRWNEYFRYGPDHVNRLASAVRRNLAMNHEFVCVTDNPTGIDEGIRIVPMWDDLTDIKTRWGVGYRRLKVFAPEMEETFGERLVWLDLDTVIVGELDPLFDRREDFMIWKDVNPTTPYCASLLMTTPGARPQLWTEFDPALSPWAARKKGYVGTDQAWIGHCLGPDEATWSADDGVYSYRYDLLEGDRSLKGARIVFFHGQIDPSQPEFQQLDWVRENWR
jgi:hypothetical protein